MHKRVSKHEDVVAQLNSRTVRVESTTIDKHLAHVIPLTATVEWLEPRPNSCQSPMAFSHYLNNLNIPPSLKTGFLTLKNTLSFVTTKGYIKIKLKSLESVRNILNIMRVCRCFEHVNVNLNSSCYRILASEVYILMIIYIQGLV